MEIDPVPNPTKAVEVPTASIPPDHERAEHNDNTGTEQPLPEVPAAQPPITLPELERSKDLSTYLEYESEQPYSDFCKSIFAYVHEIDMHQICSQMDWCHVALGIAYEYIEYCNEYDEFIDLYLDDITTFANGKLYISANGTSKLLDEESASVLYSMLRKVEKEIGDMCYYCMMAANIAGITLPLTPEAIYDTKAFENFGDNVKKKIFYKHSVELSDSIIKLWHHLAYLAEYELNTTLPRLINQNREKLMKRYPQKKFTSQDAAEKKDNA